MKNTTAPQEKTEVSPGSHSPPLSRPFWVLGRRQSQTVKQICPTRQARIYTEAFGGRRYCLPLWASCRTTRRDPGPRERRGLP